MWLLLRSAPASCSVTSSTTDSDLLPLSYKGIVSDPRESYRIISVHKVIPSAKSHYQDVSIFGGHSLFSLLQWGIRLPTWLLKNQMTRKCEGAGSPHGEIHPMGSSRQNEPKKRHFFPLSARLLWGGGSPLCHLCRGIPHGPTHVLAKQLARSLGGPSGGSGWRGNTSLGIPCLPPLPRSLILSALELYFPKPQSISP